MFGSFFVTCLEIRRDAKCVSGNVRCICLLLLRNYLGDENAFIALLESCSVDACVLLEAEMADTIQSSWRLKPYVDIVTAKSCECFLIVAVDIKFHERQQRHSRLEACR